MKRLSPLVPLLLAALGVSAPADAQQEVLRVRDATQKHDADEQQRSVSRPKEQKSEQQALREAIPVRQETEQERSAARGRARLSPEERRQLRRDINAASLDIYRRDRTK